MNQIAFEAHDRSHSFYRKQRMHHLSIFLTGGSYRGVKRSVESKVPLKSIRKDVRTPEKPVKCHVPNSLFYCVTSGRYRPSQGSFIGAEVGVALNPYLQRMHE